MTGLPAVMVTRLVCECIAYLADFPLVSLVGIFSIVLQGLRAREFVVAGRRSADVPLACNLSREPRDGSSHWLQSVSAWPVPRNWVRTLVDLTEHYYTRESSLGVSRNSGMEHVDT